jgi:hypothetical protein
VRAEASARRCQQDLAAERHQHERDLATAAEHVKVAEGRAAELRAALDVEGARAKAAEAARGAQAEATAAGQQQHEHDLATAIERVKVVDARAAELRNALEVERQRAEAAEAARDAAQTTAARAQRRESFECGRLSAALPAEGEEPALIGVPNVGLTCHLGACVIALRHVHGFCGLVEDSSPAR